MTTLFKTKFKGTHRGTNTVAALDPLLGSVGLLLFAVAVCTVLRRLFALEVSCLETWSGVLCLHALKPLLDFAGGS